MEFTQTKNVRRRKLLPAVKSITPPYCQLINTKKYLGMGIDRLNARKAKLYSCEEWQIVDHEFDSGNEERIIVNQHPRMLVLNLSPTWMSNNIEVIPYDRNRQGYKAFSYMVLWFLDRQNQPLSNYPFRFKCSNKGSIELLKHFKYPGIEDSFIQKLLAVYNQCSRHHLDNPHSLFCAHGIYQPSLARERITSKSNARSSWSIITKSFVEPTTENFNSLMISNGSPMSKRIQEQIKFTQPWIERFSSKSKE